MKKPMFLMLISVGFLFGLIFAWKYIAGKMLQSHMKALQSPTISVSAMKVEPSVWQQKLKAVGSLRAQSGVNVTTELPGLVQTIYFKPGSQVTKGEILVQLNAAAEIGELHSLQARVELAKITYERDKAQFKANAVAKQVVDTDEWNLKNLQAQVEQQTATLEKKTIRAPFSGRIGINNVSPGQYINVGDMISSLQALDPLYADFYLPQQVLAQLQIDQKVDMVTDTYPNENIQGKITTIQPIVNPNSRNVLVEATIPNSNHKLKPGMFVHIEVDIAQPQSFITVPQSAISFNPYGDIAYVVEDSGKKDSNNQPILIVNQVFVTLGDRRGEEVAVVKGLKKGDIVVTSGQLKLKNGSQVKIDNSMQSHKGKTT